MEVPIVSAFSCCGVVEVHKHKARPGFDIDGSRSFRGCILASRSCQSDGSTFGESRHAPSPQRTFLLRQVVHAKLE